MASPPTRATATTSPATGSPRRLRTAILDGSYRPGERIRQEDVAARSGASRIPVREALRMLAAEGLVTLVANSGAWVTRLTLAECAELYLIRERLEPLLLRGSMPRLGEAEIGRLAELTEAMEAAGTDVDAFLRADREFHLSSYAGAAPGETWQIIHRMWNTTQHYRREFTQRAARAPVPATAPATGRPPPAGSASRTWNTGCSSTACAGRTRTTPSGCSSCTSAAPGSSWRSIRRSSRPDLTVT